MRGTNWSGAFASSADQSETAWSNRNSENEAAIKEAEPVTQAEAKWLSERIGRDGVLHENEKALLSYINSEADHIDPILQPLLDKVM